jgi:hypothetical protein
MLLCLILWAALMCLGSASDALSSTAQASLERPPVDFHVRHHAFPHQVPLLI